MSRSDGSTPVNDALDNDTQRELLRDMVSACVRDGRAKVVLTAVPLVTGQLIQRWAIPEFQPRYWLSFAAFLTSELPGRPGTIDDEATNLLSFSDADEAFESVTGLVNTLYRVAEGAEVQDLMAVLPLVSLILIRMASGGNPAIEVDTGKTFLSVLADAAETVVVH